MKSALLIITTALLLATTATVHAGPPVTVTIKNLNTTTAATYSIITNNESLTYANSTPKPPTPVPPSTMAAPFVVQSTLSPDVNFASIRYKVGSKTCVYYTAYVNGTGPQWSKSATPSGGATCTATITAINPATAAWSVELTIK